MKILIAATLLLGVIGDIGAQNDEKILRLLACWDVEQLSPSDYERLEELLRHPLPLNLVSSSKLEESGLFSHYQLASLNDYRSRHGDVVSFAELALIDGFNPDFVSRLSPFISLETHLKAAFPGYSGTKNEFFIKAAVKYRGRPTYGLKYKLSVGERFNAGLAVSRTSAAAKLLPDAYSAYAGVYFKRVPGKVLAGDFNARFGQGLALWSGSDFGGLTTASSFMKKPSGITVSSSYTGLYSLRGAASEFNLGNWRLTAALAFGKLSLKPMAITPVVNLAKFFRTGRISLTQYLELECSDRDKDVAAAGIKDMKTAVEAAFCLNGIDIFGEFSLDWRSLSLAALSGVYKRMSDNLSFAAMLRYYPFDYSSDRSSAARSASKCSNEYAASAALDWSAGKWVLLNDSATSTRVHQGTFSLDAAYFPQQKSSSARLKSLQFKTQAEWKAVWTSSLITKLRLSERIRTWGQPFRTEVRTDLSYVSELLSGSLRLNFLHSRELSFLGYIEAAYKTNRVKLYLRQGCFFVDNWEDRIYCYERDAPGNFNVPAFYGRGLWTALLLGWRFSEWGKLYCRAALTLYPFMAVKKPGTAELKFTFSSEF